MAYKPGILVPLLLSLLLLLLSACDGTTTPEMVAVPANATLGTAAFRVDSLENSVQEIDSVETAEVREGATPKTLVTYAEAVAFCEAVSKRICTYSEWVAACKGEELLKYSFQATHELPQPLSETCVTGRGDFLGELYSSAESSFPRPAGENRNCATPNLGVRDMVGNLSEWVLLEDATGAIAGTPHTGGVPAGGNHLTLDEQNHCDFILFRDVDNDGIEESLFPESTRSDRIGFRCCQDPT